MSLQALMGPACLKTKAIIILLPIVAQYHVQGQTQHSGDVIWL